MRKAFLYVPIIFFYAVITFSGGCAPQDSPENVVLLFLKAVHGSDVADIDKTLSFERLIEQQEGQGYLGLPADKKGVALEMFRNNMVREITSGKLSYLGDVDPRVEKADGTGDKAEVTVMDRKKGKQYLFLLSKEGGVWKIYSISG
jgi:hypothetical protein